MKGRCLYPALYIFSTILLIAQERETKITLDASDLRTKIEKNIYGQFSEHLGNCIYGGFWVGENSKIPNTRGIRNDVVEALKKAKIPVLRWPGGCFADEYHWKDGIGPREKRPSMINTNWGGVTEDNSFGTHEFLDLCGQLGCEPYITGNIGSGTVQEFSQWVEYINSDNVSPMTDLRKKNGYERSWGVKFFGIGNESWGCGGNMRPEFYADQVRRYSSFIKNYGKNRTYQIACGANSDDYNWTEVLMKNAAGYFSGLSLHYYTWKSDKPATDINDSDWFDVMKKTLKMEELLTRHSAIMDKYDPNKKVGLIVDEWGTWTKVEPGTNPGFLYQQNTLRDAIVAASNLNIFNNHADRVRMANIAQIINVLQSMILTKNENMILTPTYHVFNLYKVHQDALLIPMKIETGDYSFGNQKLPAINCSASIDRSGRIHISLCNIDPVNEQKISCDLLGFQIKKISGQIITADKMNAHNSFENPDVIESRIFSEFESTGQTLRVAMPSKSVVMLEIEGTRDVPPAIILTNPEPGVIYNYYEGRWQRIPSFKTLVPQSSGVIDKFEFPKESSEENFGVSYNGYIKIPATGLYTFYVTSDDGCTLLIDGKLIVDNDGEHGPVEQSGSSDLTGGYHIIQVDFFQSGGGKTLEIDFEGPGINKEIIPASLLFRKP